MSDLTVVKECWEVFCRKNVYRRNILVRITSVWLLMYRVFECGYIIATFKCTKNIRYFNIVNLIIR